jgi:GNAT superfamily N-acetyltransferase
MLDLKIGQANGRQKVNNGLQIRNMTRAEVDELVEWAAREGWNPGLHDAEIFWQTDPDAYVAAELDGEMIGGGAITSYDGKFGFMGFFIVRPEYRGRGFGNSLWHIRKERLLNRLEPGAAIGMDGVFDMQAYYARGGFVFSHRDIRFQSTGVDSRPDASIVPLQEVPFDAVLAYDSQCFPAPRPAFMKAWISQPDSLALGVVEDDRLAGFGVIRRCREGCKIGPLFVDDAICAEKLYTALIGLAPGEPVFLDAPENNPAATALARKFDMQEVFGCARMYLGPTPSVASDRIFGVTTFELG